MPDFPWGDLWERHKGKITGSLLGLVFGLLIRWIGLFWALFVGFCMIGGYIAGRRVDEGFEDLETFVERIRMRSRRP